MQWRCASTALGYHRHKSQPRTISPRPINVMQHRDTPAGKALSDEQLDQAILALREMLAERAGEAANVIEGTAEAVARLM
jgi:hypothetical protein